jgi:hypothetical protein
MCQCRKTSLQTRKRSHAHAYTHTHTRTVTATQTHTGTRTCTHIHTHSCTRRQAHTHTHIHMLLQTHTHTSTYTHTHVHMHPRAHACACTHTHTHTDSTDAQTCARARTYACAHTHTHPCTRARMCNQGNTQVQTRTHLRREEVVYIDKLVSCCGALRSGLPLHRQRQHQIDGGVLGLPVLLGGRRVLGQHRLEGEGQRGGSRALTRSQERPQPLPFLLSSLAWRFTGQASFA